jgi:hypothetical protein
MSTAILQTAIVETAGMGENACPFLAFRIIKCADVMESSRRIHAKPIKAGRVFNIRAAASMRNLLLSKSLTCILSYINNMHI